jgi:hypothetical protein
VGRNGKMCGKPGTIKRNEKHLIFNNKIANNPSRIGELSILKNL